MPDAPTQLDRIEAMLVTLLDAQRPQAVTPTDRVLLEQLLPKLEVGVAFTSSDILNRYDISGDYDARKLGLAFGRAVGVPICGRQLVRVKSERGSQLWSLVEG